MYDSTKDTLEHIDNVRRRLSLISFILRTRAELHDQSKLESPEKEIFDEFTPKLKDITYGSEEYKACLDAMGEALDHHYAMNRHHPQHFENGVSGMTLIDVVEMFCDWSAAASRHADGSFQKSIQMNADRFVIDPQLTAIFENTRRELGW